MFKRRAGKRKNKNEIYNKVIISYYAKNAFNYYGFYFYCHTTIIINAYFQTTKIDYFSYVVRYSRYSILIY